MCNEIEYLMVLEMLEKMKEKEKKIEEPIKVTAN